MTLPDPLAEFVRATGALAAAAVEEGRRADARRLLEDALRALDTGASASLRVLDGGRGS